MLVAGPVASVWFRASGVDGHAHLRTARAACGNTTGSDQDFQLETRPFLARVGPEHTEELSELYQSGLVELLGWAPAEKVAFSAMSNAAEDHRLLARLCLVLCEETQGVVDFCGRMPFGPELDSSHRSSAVRLSNPQGIEGTLYATSYDISAGRFGTAHYGDAHLLRSWLIAPDFRMLK